MVKHRPAAPPNLNEEKTMTKLQAVVLGTLIALAAPAAWAEEAAVAQPRGAKTITTTPAAAPATPVKISQQDKMRLCAKQATGKKGAERKTFMKGCLSKKA
jgi:hypothetical protein